MVACQDLRTAIKKLDKLLRRIKVRAARARHARGSSIAVHTGVTAHCTQQQPEPLWAPHAVTACAHKLLLQLCSSHTYALHVTLSHNHVTPHSRVHITSHHTPACTSQRKREDDVEQYPSCHEFATRIASGLKHVVVICSTGQGKTGDSELAHALMRTAMNYR